MLGIGCLCSMIVGFNRPALGQSSDPKPPLKAASSAPGASVLVIVGNRAITQDDLRHRLRTLPPFQRKRYQSPEAQVELLNIIVEEELLNRAALDAGLDQAPSIVRRVEAFRNSLMRQAYAAQILDEVLIDVSEQDVLDYYKQHQAQFTHKPSVVVRHVLYSTREAAERGQKRLQEGASFELLALEESLDRTTGDRGGYLGAVSQGVGHPRISQHYNAEVDAALFGSKPREISPILQTDLGYHIFKILDVQPSRLQPLEEIRSFIEGTLRQQVQLKQMAPHFDTLKKRYGYVVRQAISPEHLVPSSQ
jgi:peptidyl-prolyl cis-trans isomerase C